MPVWTSDYLIYETMCFAACKELRHQNVMMDSSKQLVWSLPNIYNQKYSSRIQTLFVINQSVCYAGFIDNDAVQELISERVRMKHFNHSNVMTLLGVCLDGG